MCEQLFATVHINKSTLGVYGFVLVLSVLFFVDSKYARNHTKAYTKQILCSSILSINRFEHIDNIC